MEIPGDADHQTDQQWSAAVCLQSAVRVAGAAGH